MKYGENAEWRYSPGLEYTVAPLNAPSKIRIGVRTKRGPISTSEVCGGPFGCKGSFSMIYNGDCLELFPNNVMERTYLEVPEPDFVIKY